jgi:mevalonate kinase
MHNQKKIIVSAPGSLMLMGEHAVLHDKHALVMAINQRLRVLLTPNSSKQINIVSENFPNYTTAISELRPEEPYALILQAIHCYRNLIDTGFDLRITSDFTDQLGFGSSAAVTVATLAALSQWLHGQIIKADIMQQAQQVIRAVQGLGSGADAAASIYGGVLLYQKLKVISRFAAQLKITAVYSGNKVKTAQVIEVITPKITRYPELYHKIFNTIDECVLAASESLKNINWQNFGELMNIHQGLQDAIGVNTPILQNLIEQLRTDENILGAKISGAGLGDCVIGLGKAKKIANVQFNLIAEAQGVNCESG